MNYTTNLKILQDEKNGKKIDWRGKRIKNETLSVAFEELELKKRAERVWFCGTMLKFVVCANGHKKLIYANFCKDRLCPMCSWRRSKVLHRQIMQVIHRAAEQNKMRFIFLTLTVENVYEDKLNDSIDELFEGFNRLFKYKEVDKNIIGYARKLEITYDGERFITANRYKNAKRYYDNKGLKTGDLNPNYDKYHPHMHVLLAVKPAYFSRGYISQSDWTSLFQKAMKVEYVPVVHVAAVKPKRKLTTDEKSNKDTLMYQAIAETAKYNVKDSDYLRNDGTADNEVIEVLAEALKGRRLFAFGKLFKTIHKELNLKDVESNDIELIQKKDKAECNCEICKSELFETIYKWDFNIRNYVCKDDKVSS